MIKVHRDITDIGFYIFLTSTLAGGLHIYKIRKRLRGFLLALLYTWETYSYGLGVKGSHPGEEDSQYFKLMDEAVSNKFLDYQGQSGKAGEITYVGSRSVFWKRIDNLSR
jgi:hypothetical protein